MSINITEITNEDKERFKKLQEQGILPSQALKKIETEKRLGIVTDTKKKIFSEENLFYGGLAVIGIGMIYIYFKGSSSPSALSTKSLSLEINSLDKIEGLDLKLLNICKEKGLL